MRGLLPICLVGIGLSACHDLDAIPRVGEVDAAVDASVSDSGVTDSDTPADSETDTSVPMVDSGRMDAGELPGDAGLLDSGQPDARPPVLPPRRLSLMDGNFFQVREAVSMGDGVFAVGARRPLDNTGLSQAMVGYSDLASDVVWVESFGLGQNDQLNTAVSLGGEAISMGITREPTVGEDDVLIARYRDDGQSEFASFGTASNDSPFDVTSEGGELIAVGRIGANAAIFVFPEDLSSGLAYTFMIPRDDSHFYGVAASSSHVAVAGATLTTPRLGVVAIFSRETFVLESSFLVAVDNMDTRLLDVAIDQDANQYVAVGRSGNQAVRVEGQLRTAMGLEIRTAWPGSELQIHQVYIDASGEYYSGRSELFAMVGRRMGDGIAYSRTPFERNPREGDLIAFGPTPVLVANNWSENGDEADTSDLNEIYFSPLNADFRLQCVQAERTVAWQSPPVTITSEGEISVPVAMVGGTYDAQAMRETVGIDEVCPEP